MQQGTRPAQSIKQDLLLAVLSNQFCKCHSPDTCSKRLTDASWLTSLSCPCSIYNEQGTRSAQSLKQDFLLAGLSNQCCKCQLPDTSCKKFMQVAWLKIFPSRCSMYNAAGDKASPEHQAGFTACSFVLSLCQDWNIFRTFVIFGLLVLSS